MVKTTRAQREALCRKWQEAASIFDHTTYREFRKSIQPCFDGSGCIMVPWSGMWLGIETDGYCHS
jgi:hypothetical protein